MTQQVNLLDRLARIETATIGHFRSEGFMRPDLQCLHDEVRIAGPALTVRLPGDDGSALVVALSSARAGDVLVVERAADERHACWGAVMAAAARRTGVAGVVIDGFVTDVSALRASGVPVWCRGRSPLTTKLRGGGAVGGWISCGGVEVRGADLILADENGVCVVDPAEAEEILARAQAIQDREPAILSRIEAGEAIASIYASL